MSKNISSFYNIKPRVFAIILLLITPFSLSIHAQPQTVDTPKEMVTYKKQSNFIKEFDVPVNEVGLKGITTDSNGNAWFYHSTNKTSTIFKLEPQTEKFTPFNIEGNTAVDNAVINLAGGQMVFDVKRNVIWFTDARTNSIGKLDVNTGRADLVSIPTLKSGPMGIVLSPDGNTIWFTEIIANKISTLDIKSMKITEYDIGANTGPTFLAFDKNGILWVTQSFSNNILLVEPWSLVPGVNISMPTVALPRPDMFSPFGIAILNNDIYSNRSNNNNNTSKQTVFVSDHGSSRIVVSDSDFNNYTSYWTSPSQTFPTTLPSQIVTDKQGNNIYFPQHGGNRITKLNVQSGIMTEYEIPTGPLSTAIFLAISDDGKKVWFTEWASNKVAYLDTTIPIPFIIKINENRSLVLDKNSSEILAVSITNNDTRKQTSETTIDVDIGIVGMTDSGLQGIIYTVDPQSVSINKTITNSTISFKATDEAKPGKYAIMARASTVENETFISQLYPISIILDVPMPISAEKEPIVNRPKSQTSSEDMIFRDIVRYSSLSAAIGLGGYAVYRKIRGRQLKRNKQ